VAVVALHDALELALDDEVELGEVVLDVVLELVEGELGVVAAEAEPGWLCSAQVASIN